MIVKIKKMHDLGVRKVAAGGEIKEVILNEYMETPSQERIQICFRGERSSGIVELSDKEAKELHKTLGSKLKLIGRSKVFREKG